MLVDRAAVVLGAAVDVAMAPKKAVRFKVRGCATLCGGFRNENLQWPVL